MAAQIPFATRTGATQHTQSTDGTHETRRVLSLLTNVCEAPLAAHAPGSASAQHHNQSLLPHTAQHLWSGTVPLRVMQRRAAASHLQHNLQLHSVGTLSSYTQPQTQNQDAPKSGTSGSAAFSQDPGPQMSSCVTIEAQFNLSMRVEPLRRLELCVTQEKDLYFLYSFSLSCEDFHTIKHSQQLLVDFPDFPAKLIELLGACSSTFVANNDTLFARHTPGSTVSMATPSTASGLFAQLLIDSNNSTAELQIVESTSFRQIVHLVLRLNSAPDAVIKRHLAMQVENYRLRVEPDLRNQVTFLQAELDALKASSKKQVTELEQTIVESKATIEQIRAQSAADQIAAVSEAIASARLDKDAEVKRIETVLRSKEKEFEGRVKQLETQTCDARKSAELERVARERSEAQSLELRASNTQLAEQLALAAAQGASSTAKAESATRDANDAKAALERISVELQHAKDSERRTLDALRRADELKESAELAAAQSAREKAQASFDAASAARELSAAQSELAEARAANERANNELRAVKGKLKLKGVVAIQQERLLDERSRALTVATEELESLRRQVADLQQRLTDNTQIISKYENECHELKQQCSERQSMIDWLNGQLNVEAYVGIDSHKNLSNSKSKIANDEDQSTESSFCVPSYLLEKSENSSAGSLEVNSYKAKATSSARAAVAAAADAAVGATRTQKSVRQSEKFISHTYQTRPPTPPRKAHAMRSYTAAKLLSKGINIDSPEKNKKVHHHEISNNPQTLDANSIIRESVANSAAANAQIRHMQAQESNAVSKTTYYSKDHENEYREPPQCVSGYATQRKKSNFF